MAGELWLAEARVGKEITPGTAVTCTRRVYLTDPVATHEHTPRPYRFATGTRDNQRGHTIGPTMAGGSFTMPVSSEEIIEWLLMGMKSGVTPTVAGGTAQLWTFTPGTTLDSATLEMNDGARWNRITGVRVNSLSIAGAAQEANTLSCDLYGQAHSFAGPTGSPTDRTPQFFEGWETKLYIDPFGSADPTTPVPGTLISWNVNIANGLSRKYFADNTQASGGTAFGALDITASFVFEAVSATAATEFANWLAQTKRTIKLEFGQNVVISTTFKHFVDITLPGAWSGVALGGSEGGTRTYEFSYNYLYEPTLAAGVRIRAQNSRTTAF